MIRRIGDAGDQADRAVVAVPRRGRIAVDPLRVDVPLLIGPRLAGLREGRIAFDKAREFGALGTDVTDLEEPVGAERPFDAKILRPGGDLLGPVWVRCCATQMFDTVMDCTVTRLLLAVVMLALRWLFRSFEIVCAAPQGKDRHQRW